MDQTVLVAMVWYVCFVMSAVIHEASHSLAAYLGGDDTAYLGGQVSIDPIPHIRREPFGMVVLPLVTVFLLGWPLGYASAPFQLDWAHRYPRRAALMSLAGPLSNLLMALICFVILKIGLMNGYWDYPKNAIQFDRLVVGEGVHATTGLFLSILLTLNLLLAVLNLMPTPPLDGALAICLFLPVRWARKYQDFLQTPGLALIGLFVAWQLFHKVWQSVIWPVIWLLYTI